MNTTNWSREKLKSIPKGKEKDYKLWNWVKSVVPVKVNTKQFPHKIASIDGATIWIVDGEKVRHRKFMDFVDGGHDLIYGKDNPEYKGVNFIPSGQIWLDGHLDKEVLASTLYHEITERRKMAQRMSYSNAHKIANVGEKAVNKQDKKFPGRGFPR